MRSVHLGRSRHHDRDPYTRRVDLARGRVSLYRQRLSLRDRFRYRLFRPHVWVVSRRHARVGAEISPAVLAGLRPVHLEQIERFPDHVNHGG